MLAQYLDAVPADYEAQGVKLPFWRVEATSGLGLMTDRPPVFRQEDFVWEPGTPAWTSYEGDASQPVEHAGTAGAWRINHYGVPFGNFTYFGADPNTPYTLGGAEGAPPRSFTFGIKTGRDQGILWAYELEPSAGVWLPVATSGVIGGRGGLFDSNAFIRSSNRQLAITVVAIAGGAYLAFAAEAAEVAAAASAAQAADVAGGLIPAYGTNAAYAAGIAGEATTTTAEAAAALEAANAADIAGGLVPQYGSNAAYDAAIHAATPAVQGAATKGAWDALLGQAKDAAGKLVVSQVAKQVIPGKTPAQSAGVAGEYRLADGTLARVNPDGSISIIDPRGGAQVVGASGAITSQWIAGVPNSAIVAAGALVVVALVASAAR